MGLDPRPDLAVVLLRDGEAPGDCEGGARDCGGDQREEHADGEDDLRRLLGVRLVVHRAEDRQGNGRPRDGHELREEGPQRSVLGLATPPGLKLVVVDDVRLDRRGEEQLSPEGHAGHGEQCDPLRDIPFSEEEGSAQRQNRYGEAGQPGGALAETLRRRHP